MKSVYLILLIVNQFVMYSQTTPQQVDLPELGLRFTIPEGWTGQQLEDRIVLGHTSIAGLMVLFENTSETIEELLELARQPIVEDGIYLQAATDFKHTSETSIEGSYTGSYMGASVKAFAMGLINKTGSGMSILILTETDKFGDAHISEAKKLAKSVEYFKVETPDNSQFWKDRIMGTQLKYMYTSSSSDYSGGYSGISDVTTINLCTNGSFHYYSNSHASFDSNAGFGHVNSNDNSQGNYRIYSKGANTLLELTFLSGKVFEYTLSVNSKQYTLLNGTRYFITTLEGCE